MGSSRVNLYQPSTPSLLPRKLGKRTGKIGKEKGSVAQSEFSG
jgi:hypothetical protein